MPGTGPEPRVRPVDTFGVLKRFRGELERELRSVSDWWLTHAVDAVSGDIAGEVSNDNRRKPDAPLALVYAARLLWFFSAAHRYEPRADCRAAAGHCRALLGSFRDRENGGLYWMLDARKRPVSRKKQTYGMAFAVYGLCEYALAFGDDAARNEASNLVEALERHARDPDHGGYLEALDERWRPLPDVRLGDDDTNADKTMNTHLHVLEAYTGFCRTQPDTEFRTVLGSLVDLFLSRFWEPGGDHLLQYCSRDWTVYPAGATFGHDIEAGWLLGEAAGVLGDSDLQERARTAAVALSGGVLEHGLDADGAVIHGRKADGTAEPARVWWVQAEAMVGFFNAWQLTGERRFLDACLGVWEFVRTHQRDPEHGEWRWFSSRDAGVAYGYKAGPWKGPYHNGRAVLELLRRIDAVGLA